MVCCPLFPNYATDHRHLTSFHSRSHALRYPWFPRSCVGTHVLVQLIALCNEMYVIFEEDIGIKLQAVNGYYFSL